MKDIPLFQESTSGPHMWESSKYSEILVDAKELERYDLKVSALYLMRAALAEEAQMCDWGASPKLEILGLGKARCIQGVDRRP